MSSKATSVTTTTFILGDDMLRFLSFLKPRKYHIRQVSSLFSHFSIRPHFFGTASSSDPISTINCIAISQSILSKFPNCFESQGNKFAKDTSFKELLLDISDLIPDVARRFRRVSRLEPEDVLEILLGFQSECQKIEINGKKVESLWGVFNWASAQNKGFNHLLHSCEVMASVLIRYGMLREVQLLLLAMERQGISLDNNDIFSKLIEGYAKASDIERAVLVYDRIREQGFIPSLSCYTVFIDLLVRMRRTPLAFRACLDMVQIGIGLKHKDMAGIEMVVKLLCEDGMVQQARYLLKQVTALGFQISNLVVNEIASGYCEKKDFEDSLNLFVENKCSPNALVGNKIIHELCCNFGSRRANLFRLELESLGLTPNEITFGILIGWCCREGDLRTAFDLLAEMSSRGLTPVIWSYNALIGALFCEGMWNHAQDVVDEMLERGIAPNLSTFKTLLAGYCKARQFDEVKKTVYKMMNCGLIDSASLDNPLSKGFLVLGINPLSVRLKRDNDVGFSSTEFFDSLGNGLYLDTDMDEYEKRVSDILKGSMIPDFNLFLRMEPDHRNFKAALLLIDEMGHWGQELSLSVFSALVKRLCASRSNFRAYNHLIEKMPKLANQLDDEILNLLARAYCRSGLTFKGRVMFDQMLTRNIKIENETYTAMVVGFCKRGNLHDFYDCWDVAQKNKWLPGLDNSKSLIECLCQHRMLKEAFELFQSLLVFHPHSRSQICLMFLEKLCVTGFITIAHKLADELFQQGCVLDGILYNYLIRGLCKEKKYTAAFTVLDEILALNSLPCLDVSLVLIPYLCSAGKFDKAMTLREINLREKSVDQYSVDYALMKGLCMTGKVGEAANVLQDMLLKGLIPDAEMFNLLFQGYCQANSLRKVKELLGVLIRNLFSPEMSSYRNFVRLMCIQGNFKLALNLKELMVGDGRYNSLIIYNILVFYLFAAGNGFLVDKLLIEMQEKGLVLDEVSYNFLVYGFSKSKDVSSCVQYLSTMISKGFQPSYRSLQTVVTCLCDIGELGEAMKISQAMEMRGWFHGSVLQNAMVEGLVSRDKLQEAECFLDRMADKNLIPDTINYDNLIKQFCFRGRMSKAVTLLNIMLRKGNIPNSASYDYVIRGLCMRNQLDEAMDFHTEMLDGDLKPSMTTWEMLVLKLCQQGRTAEAESLLLSVVRLGETPNRLMYSSVIDRYRFENNPRKASELMQMMQQSGHEPDFDTQWSLISNLQNSKDKGNNNRGESFLSRLLSGSGFSYKKDSKLKVG
ncbi:pentatricopeptide repeat-containing protein At5g15280, mitochondrial [Euphorbia lathyris]|uniref:pentatricopeptide repeat-containing protein At5g15280, mitochondrial n=1 Tax=Euphorbia lathyris TaxID=212925 RepID=UPI003313FD2B